MEVLQPLTTPPPSTSSPPRRSSFARRCLWHYQQDLLLLPLPHSLSLITRSSAYSSTSSCACMDVLLPRLPVNPVARSPALLRFSAVPIPAIADPTYAAAVLCQLRPPVPAQALGLLSPRAC